MTWKLSKANERPSAPFSSVAACSARHLIPVAVALIFGMAPTSSADAHDWYPRDCCSGQDCYAIDEAEVELTEAGWEVMRTGEIIEHNGRRERMSEDGQFHRCSLGGDPDSRTLCLFVPSMGS